MHSWDPACCCLTALSRPIPCPPLLQAWVPRWRRRRAPQQPHRPARPPCKACWLAGSRRLARLSCGTCLGRTGGSFEALPTTQLTARHAQHAPAQASNSRPEPTNRIMATASCRPAHMSAPGQRPATHGLPPPPAVAAGDTAAHAVHRREDPGQPFPSLHHSCNARSSSAAIPALDGATTCLFSHPPERRKLQSPALTHALFYPWGKPPSLVSLSGFCCPSLPGATAVHSRPVLAPPLHYLPLVVRPTSLAAFCP